jgi:Dickkopf-like protein
MSLNPARSTRVFAGRLSPFFGVRPFLGLGLTLFLGAQVLTSCGSDDDTSCEPNSEKACFSSDCPDNEGTQTCNADGSAYSTCSCDGTGSAGNGGAAGAGGGNNGGSSGAAGAGGAPGAEFRGTVGLPCETATDCPGGLDCVPSSATGPFQNGGPEEGYCTTTCTVNEDCEAIDDIAACALGGDGNQRYCVALCQTGDPSGTELKCSLIQGQRDTLACLSGVTTPSGGRDLGLCIPVCHSDEGCGGGRFCDLGTGVCVDAPPAGAAVGAACTEDAECAGGQCLTLTGGGGFCTGLCTFGLIGGCGFDALGVPAGERTAACLVPALSTGGIGDIGYCSELCDVAEDCAQAEWTCDPLTDLFGATSDAAEVFGRAGFCNPPEPTTDAGTP